MMEQIRGKKAFICDMDGVIYHGNRLLPGVPEFVEWLKQENRRFLFLTNSSERAPRELQEKLGRLGLDVPKEHFYTSALATAAFVAKQSPGCSAYVIGETGLSNALYDADITMNDVNPDYVIIGESRNYTYENILRAVKFIQGGARLIGTNPDQTGPTEQGIVPSTGALISPIEKASGQQAYFVGKPNPLMMRTALRKIECKREDTVIVGDRMDTDIIAGVESEITTILVLSGCTSREEVDAFAYRPDLILDGVGDIPG
jgi:NagD protein